ncbi:MAG: MTAP family purine nucleoside phosphorylase [Syntrophobacterales bacterium]|nr:MTAP family purine nucleoside phosphorylase [Syntrophobacterales bacterium]
MGLLGILSGTIPLDDLQKIFSLREETISLPSGEIVFFSSSDFIFIPRHGRDRQSSFSPPHLIPHLDHFRLLAARGVEEVIGVYSAGSLHERLTPGMLMVPDDFICLYPTPSSVVDAPYHITPTLGEEAREHLLAIAEKLGFAVEKGGIYWQTSGPRLETKAEIKMISRAADIVGMTMASEAVLAQELNMNFAALCSIDNYAHGIGKTPLTNDAIYRQARKNTRVTEQIICRYIEDFQLRKRQADKV